MSNLTILQIHSAKHFGGGEVHLYQLAQGLSQKGHRVILAIREPLVEKFSQLEVEIAQLPLRNALDIPSIFKLVRIIKEKQVDIIHVHRGKGYWLGVIAAKLAKRAKVVATRHILLPLRNSYFHSRLQDNIDKFIAVSKEVKNTLVQENGLSEDKVDLIYNGVDTSKFNPQEMGSGVRQEFAIANDELVIGTVGRLTETKNQELLIKIAAQLRDRGLNPKWLIVGEDSSPNNDYKHKLESLITDFKLKDKVILTGFREDIPELMTSFDILVIPSQEESFGIVAIEAMAMKKPVVASKVGGLKEIIQEGKTGFLVPLVAEEFGDRLIKLANNPELREKMGQAGYQRVNKNFTIAAMIEQTEELYFSVL
ncbi:glycosyltransferase family 4 protein [Halanaerobaculum tunisiense]